MRTLPLTALLLLASQNSWAAETAQFLKVGVGGRALGMGGAYTALADDASALYWNPGGLSQLEKREVAASHAELFESTRLDFLAYAHPTPQGTFSAGATYLSQPAIEGRDSLGRPTADFQASDAALSLGYGRKLDVLDAGLAVKYVRSHIGSAEAQTFALDLGARRELEGLGAGKLVLGAALRNLGPGMKFDGERNDLPLLLALGAGYKLAGGHALALELVNGPRGTGTDASLGGEYQALKNAYLRAGYTTQTAVTGGSSFDAARGLTLGMGLRNEKWELSYAVLPMGELGRSHRFGLGARF